MPIDSTSVSNLNNNVEAAGGILQTIQSAGIAIGIVSFILFLFFIATSWRIFTKAKKPGWASIIPIYSFVVFLQIVKRPVWWIVLLIIPLVNIIILIIAIHDLSKAFGKGVGFTLGQIFLPIIFLPILAFGSAQYKYE